MKGLVVPEAEEDFAADPVEIFFDLAYVFAFSQLVGVLVHHPDWEHVGKSAIIFTILWLAWSQVTWAANAVAGNSRQARLVFLGAAAVSVPMAASVSTAFDNSPFLFVIPVVLILSLNITLALEGARDEDGNNQGWEFVIGLAAFSALLLVGAFVEDGARVALWTAAAIGFVISAYRTSDTDWTLRPGHFAERHGLIIIVALGEVIVAVGKPLVDSLEEGDSFSTEAIVALTAAGIFACLMWWAYFDRVQGALEYGVEHTTGPAKSSLARDAYTFLHLFIVAGVILAAAGLEEITLHPDEPLPLAFRSMLFGGLFLFFTGIGLSVYRTFRVIARERLVGTAAIAALLFGAPELNGVWHIVGINLILAVALAVEHARVEGSGRTDSADADLVST